MNKKKNKIKIKKNYSFNTIFIKIDRLLVIIFPENYHTIFANFSKDKK